MNFTKYGVCTNTPDKVVNPTFTSFAISASNPQNCPISFIDSQNRLYKVLIKQEPPFPLGPPGPVIADKYYPAYIDCSGNPAGSFQAQWCRTPPGTKTPVAYGVFGYTEKGTGGSKTNKNYIVGRPACALNNC